MARDLGKRFLPGARTWDRHQVVDVLDARITCITGRSAPSSRVRAARAYLLVLCPAGVVDDG
jgi:hypothetical protein